MNARKMITAALAAAAILAAAPAMAMSVSPILIDIKPASSSASGQIRVINTAETELPVALSATSATVEPDGTVKTAPDDDDLLLFPPQAILKPGATQVFRVQYVGDPDLKQSKTYLVSVAQQPVQLPQGTSGIQLLYDFQVVVNVAPLTGRPDLKLISSELTTDAKGARRAAITLMDDSDVHAYLSGAKLTLELDDAGGHKVWAQSWVPEEIAGSVGIGLVQPHATRRFVLPFDLPAQGDKLQAEIRYEGRP
jgi:fimbrial chaperone protein